MQFKNILIENAKLQKICRDLKKHFISLFSLLCMMYVVAENESLKTNIEF